jgi:hypothetical protein
VVVGPPDGAEITSRDRLPFRVRDEGSYRLRAGCSGTAVVLGGGTFEVLSEHSETGRVVYRLRPWHESEIIRDRIVYDDMFVRSVLAERERASIRARARPFRAILYPVIGSLPEADQERLSERYGLYALDATLSSALAEFLLFFCLVWWIPRKDVGLAFATVLTAPGLGLIPVFALGRALSALTLRETAGQWLVVALVTILRPDSSSRRHTTKWMPLTRRRFWQLLAEQDEVESQEDGSVVLRSVLPHVSWVREHRALVSGVQWAVETLPARVGEGGPVFAYRMVPPVGSEQTPAPPDGRIYARSVRDAIDAEWEDVLVSLGSLVSCLSADVQRRAVGRRGGAARLRSAVLGTVCFLGGMGVLILIHALGGPSADPLAPTLILVGTVLTLDSVWRLVNVAQGDYAPSVVRFALPKDLLRPERLWYRLHRDAWREAASGGGSSIE